MKKHFLYLILFLFVSISAFGWGGKTHNKLTHYSWIKSSKLGNIMFLLSLNLDKGMLNERLSDGNDETTPDEWLQFGAEHEDDSRVPKIPDRSNFHFHNPLKEWSEAGLSDIHVGASGSSILWAQNSLLQAVISDNKKKARTWYVARDYYYKGLIEFVDKELRNSYFAEMFKTLGNQVHLIQDMAVPDHVRNDTHVLNSAPYWTGYNKVNNSFRCIEGWADYNSRKKDGKIETIASGAAQTPLIDFSIPANPECPVPIAFLSDTKQYKISQTPLAGLNQGLAEYTSANFFSEDTIFTEGYQHDHVHWFPHPSKSETNIMTLNMPHEVTAEDGRKDWVKPVNKKNGGEDLDNLVFAGYYENRVDKETYDYRFTFFLSDICHEEYAKKLVPRAVGYSAALLDYFFRGEIEISLPECNPGINPPQMEGIYSLCSDPAIGFDKLSLMVRNITENNEEMTNGKVTLVVSYRTCTGDPFAPDPPRPTEERKFISVDYQGEVTIPRDNPLRINFDLSEHPLPFNAMDVTLTVVFKGNLGAELTDAVAIGFKDISEPTPIDFFNNTDKICYKGNYVNYDDTVLWDEVDINPKNGRIDCLNNAEINITRKRIGQQTAGVYVYLSFNGKPAMSTNYYFRTDSGWEILPGEAPNRFFVLTNASGMLNYSILVHTKSIENPGECLSYYDYNIIHSFSPYKNKLVWTTPENQNDPYYKHDHSVIGIFRGFPHWNILIFENTTVPKDSECSQSSLGGSFPLSQSKNSAPFDTPQINNVFPQNK